LAGFSGSFKNFGRLTADGWADGWILGTFVFKMFERLEVRVEHLGPVLENTTILVSDFESFKLSERMEAPVPV
jgi:hypothetical protein